MTDDDLPDELFLVDVPQSEARTLSFRRAPTVLLTFAANRFTRQSARLFQDRFGIGAMDWRMLVMLTREPGSTVSHSARTIGIDKAAVSRSLRRMEEKGLAVPAPDRPTEWSLTDPGRRLHAEILALALDRQKRLLAGLSADEVATFTKALSLFLTNLETLDD